VIRGNRRRIGRGRGRGTLARTWAPSRPAGSDHERADGGVVARALVFGAAAFLLIYIVAAVVVLGALLDVVVPANEIPDAADAARARWLVIPLELAGMTAALTGAALAGWRLVDGGERSPRRLTALSVAGPVAAALLLLVAGGFAGGILRALLDMVVVVGGGLLGTRIIVRRLGRASSP
jgi:hypothetical protein